ncbi:EI24 domain-containing protein [uncultured Roseobacter sp.]|uniref:EI24 domain-containing protein n=1 Tax=uncultured Roseobacter sp. TaxID=114847 RepID=UPI002638D837|nr:EI24 domain-containing protein [uncultured Roseobacter sp.]
MILDAFFRSLGQLSDPRFRRVFLTGIILTLALLIGTSAGFVWLIGWIVGEETTLPLIGEVRWLNDLASWGSALLLAVLSIFLMVPVASAITSMFLETVAQAVEDEHYPRLGPAERVPFGDALRDTINFLGVLVGANIVALILYVLFAPFAPFIFWALNGFLLGREYFTLAAIRRVGRTKARALRNRHSIRIWVAGILMAVPLSIPLLNLLIPILGAATFTHLFHRLAPQAPYDRTSPDP